MSLRPQPALAPVPETTARIAQTAFCRGNPYLRLRDRLGPVFADAAFADLYPTRGQPAYAPWRLALVTLLQFREGLSDRQAAEAVRARIDWKYLLALDSPTPASTTASCASSGAGCCSTRLVNGFSRASWMPRAITACSRRAVVSAPTARTCLRL
jgi:hypothetical protein